MRLFLDIFLGLFITTLVAGIDHVYHAPPESIALNRPMLTTASVDTGDAKLPRFHFSFSPSILKSLYVVAVGNLEAVNRTALSQLRHTK